MRVIEQHGPSKSNVLSSKSATLATPWKRVALYVTIASGFFLLGFVPMWLRADAAIEQRDAAQRGVRLAQLEHTLAAAMIEVQRGQFEPARQLTSDFYTNLRRHVDAGDGALFSAAQREGLRSLLGERDELVTLLAKRDPSATERLFAVYSSYNKLANNRA